MIHRAVGGTDQDLVIFAGSGRRRRWPSWSGCWSSAARPARQPGGARPVVLVGPFEHHSNLLPLARVGRRGGGHRRGPERAGRPGRAGGGAGPPRRTAAAGRRLLGRLQRHRHPGRQRPDRRPAAPPRGAVGLGLLGRRPYLPIRMGESAPGAGDHKDAVFFSPHKFVGGPQTPGSWSSAATWPATRSRPCPGAAPSPSSTRSASATWTTRWPGRRAAPPGSSSRSGPGWSWPSRRPSGPT